MDAFNQIPGDHLKKHHIVENREFYNQHSPFSGVVGIGVGPLASRPTTCTTGVGYWATDQGSWNTLRGGDGVFYKCTATNTWSHYYTPYVSPHPLQRGRTSSDVNQPTAPTNLIIK